MQSLLIIISLATGFMAGAHYAYLLRKVNGLYEAIQAGRQEVRRKNTGVVRPGIVPPSQLPDEPERRSAVVRPRIPVDEIKAETNAALASARNRTASK